MYYQSTVLTMVVPGASVTVIFVGIGSIPKSAAVDILSEFPLLAGP